MSGAQTSPFPNQNDLMTVATQNIANYYAPERNRLFVQAATQEQGGREMEAMSRAASGLLALPDEETRAAQYPKTIQYLQANGFAKNAPPVYPGEAVTKHLASLGIPAADQYKLAADRSAKQALFPDAPGTAPAAGTPAVPSGGGDTGSAVPRDPAVPTIGQQANNPGNLSAGVPGSTGFITAADGQKVGVFPDVQTGVAAHAWQLARYGAAGVNTVQAAVDRWVGVPGKDNTAYVNAVATKLGVKPGDPINLADPAVQKAFILAQQPYESGRQWLTPEQVDAGIVLASNPNFGKGAAARIPGAVNVAGPGAGTAPAVTPPAVPAPGGTTAEQPGNQPLLNRLSVFGGGAAEPPPVAPAVAPAPAQAPVVPTPPAPAPTPTLPELPVPQAPNIQANGFTPEQTRWLRTLRDNPSVSADELRKAQDTLRTQNTTAVEKYQADVKAYRQDVETRQEHARTQARWEAEQKNKGVPAGYRVSAADPDRLEPIPGGPKDPADPANKGQIAKNDAEVANIAFQQANKLRDEFQTLTKDFRIVQTSYENVQKASQAKDGAADMSMLYNYVRLLDPTSVVRESEFAAAAQSGSLGERMKGAVERILTGARLPDDLRQTFVRESRNLYDVQLRSHDTVADQYERLARDSNIDPKVVVTRFARPQPDAAAAPVVIKTDADFEKLPPGTLFTAPDGTTRRKP